MTNNFIYLDQDAYYDLLYVDKDFMRQRKQYASWAIGIARSILTSEAYAECLRLCEENGEEPKTYKQAFLEVLDNVDAATEDVGETAWGSFYDSIDGWEEYYGTCYEGLTLDYVDDADFVEEVASGCRKYLRSKG